MHGSEGGGSGQPDLPTPIGKSILLPGVIEKLLRGHLISFRADQTPAVNPISDFVRGPGSGPVISHPIK